MVSNTAGTRNNLVGVSRSEGPLLRTLPVRVQSLVSDTRLARVDLLMRIEVVSTQAVDISKNENNSQMSTTQDPQQHLAATRAVTRVQPAKPVVRHSR